MKLSDQICVSTVKYISNPFPQIKKPPQGWFDYLVEMGGIEPPSASTPPSALHAYFVY